MKAPVCGGPGEQTRPRVPDPRIQTPSDVNVKVGAAAVLDKAREFGATEAVPSGASGWKRQVLALTDGQGVDVALEAVGIPATLSMCTDIIRPGGNVANTGVHGKPVELHLEGLRIRSINISMVLVNADTTPVPLKPVAQKKVPAEKFAAHHFSSDQFIEGYDTFAKAAETKALKVVVTA